MQNNVSPQAQQFINQHVGIINQAFATNNQGYHVTFETVQQFNGTNHFLHIVGQNDGRQYTITVHVPFNGQPTITEFGPGHLPHQQGYSNIGFNQHGHQDHHGHHGHHSSHGHHHNHHHGHH
jgi:hypothetical protein